MFELNGKIAVVTGAGGYIGGETALTLAKQGAKVAVCDINQESIEKTVSRIKEIGGIAKGYVIDVTDSSDVEKVVKNVVKDFGEINISIHVAGGSARICGPNSYAFLIDQKDEVIDKVLKVNLYGAFYVARACGRVMRDQGKGGRIISFSSTVGINGLKHSVDYAAAKGGVISMTKALSKELGEYGITVNSVAPGVVARADMGSDENYTLNTNFLHKKCLATDIASLVAFMVSDEARFITGQTYIIDGGRSLAMKGTD